jgi:hypothetical protein
MDFHLTDIEISSGENDPSLLFEHFMENSPVPAWISNQAGSVCYSNPAFRKLFNPSGAGAAGINQGFFPSENDLAFSGKLKLVVETGKTLVENRRWLLENGSVNYYRLARFVIRKGDVPLIGGWAFNITREKSWHDHALELKKNKRKEMLRLMIEARENERESIATQLRDTISQTLAYCSLTVQDAIQSSSLFKVADYIQQAITELNRISWTISHAVVTDFGLQEGIINYVDYFCSVNPVSVKTEFIQEGMETLSLPEKINIFRIVQNYLLSFNGNPHPAEAEISIEFFSPTLQIKGRYSDPSFLFNEKKEEFIDMKLRIDYYNGFLSKTITDGWQVITIELRLPG